MKTQKGFIRLDELKKPDIPLDNIVSFTPEENADLFEKELLELVNKYAPHTEKIYLLKKLNWVTGNVIVS